MRELDDESRDPCALCAGDRMRWDILSDHANTIDSLCSRQLRRHGHRGHCLSLTPALREADTGFVSNPKRPRDTNQLAKMIVDLTTRATVEPADVKDARMAARGRLGGLKGGTARAAALPDTKRRQIARKAAAARWKGRKKDV